MRLAKIEAGVVVNIIEADANVEGYVLMHEGDAEVGIGCQYVDGVFVRPAPPVIAVVDPVAKLTAFLSANPDVAALLQ